MGPFPPFISSSSSSLLPFLLHFSLLFSVPLPLPSPLLLPMPFSFLSPSLQTHVTPPNSLPLQPLYTPPTFWLCIALLLAAFRKLDKAYGKGGARVKNVSRRPPQSSLHLYQPYTHPPHPNISPNQPSSTLTP